MPYIVFAKGAPSTPIQWFGTRQQAEDFINREPSIVRSEFFIREGNPSTYVPPGSKY